MIRHLDPSVGREGGDPGCGSEVVDALTAGTRRREDHALGTGGQIAHERSAAANDGAVASGGERMGRAWGDAAVASGEDGDGQRDARERTPST